jgi:hypothetical protein
LELPLFLRLKLAQQLHFIEVAFAFEELAFLFKLLALFVAKTGLVLSEKVGLADHIWLGCLVWGDGVW